MAMPEKRSGACVVLVHPDGEKTVCAKANAAKMLEICDIDFSLLEQSKSLFVEGYLINHHPD